MPHPRLLNHNRHNRILIRPPPLLMHPNDLVDLDVTHQIPVDKDKVARDEPAGVYIAHRVPGRVRLFGGHDRRDLHPRAGFGPF